MCPLLLLITKLLLKPLILIISSLYVVSLGTSLPIPNLINILILDLCWCDFGYHRLCQYCEKIRLFIFLLRNRCWTLNIHLFHWWIKWFLWWRSLCLFCCWFSHKPFGSISLTIQPRHLVFASRRGSIY